MFYPLFYANNSIAHSYRTSVANFLLNARSILQDCVRQFPVAELIATTLSGGPVDFRTRFSGCIVSRISRTGVCVVDC